MFAISFLNMQEIIWYFLKINSLYFLEQSIYRKIEQLIQRILIYTLHKISPINISMVHFYN